MTQPERLKPAPECYRQIGEELDRRAAAEKKHEPSCNCARCRLRRAVDRRLNEEPPQEEVDLILATADELDKVRAAKAGACPTCRRDVKSGQMTTDRRPPVV